jgi:hypothetical protein
MEAFSEAPERLVQRFRQYAEEHGMVVVAPYFDYPEFPSYGMLNIGLLRARADLRVLSILATVSRQVRVQSDRFWFYEDGPARGFVPWFAQAHPHRIARAAICRPRRYPILKGEGAFPFGMARNPFAPDLGPASLTEFLKTPLLFLADQTGTGLTVAELSEFGTCLRDAAANPKTAVHIEIDMKTAVTEDQLFSRACDYLFTGMPAAARSLQPSGVPAG